MMLLVLLKSIGVQLLLAAAARNLTAFAFVVSPTSKSTISCLYDGGSPSSPRRSRIEGNQRQPSEQDVEIMDEMITKLADAKPYDLPNAVRRAFRVISSPQFFLRIAQRSDMASDDTEKEKLGALASNLVSTLEAVVETTEETLDERAKEVEEILKAAAEPRTGEFLVPLFPEQVEEMRKVVEQLEPSSLDEGFLSTVDAYMMKSHEDGMDGMVTILQKVLQVYSGVTILRTRNIIKNSDNEESESSSASECFEQLLTVDADQWESEIQRFISDDRAQLQSLIDEIQKTTEKVVFGLENGSMAQRVQAEYLRELVSRIEAMRSFN